MNLPILNVAGWSVHDYECAYDALSKMGCAGAPYMAGDGPAAGFVADVVEGWMDWQLDEVVSNLRSAKFDGPDDGRRIKILLRHDLDYSGKSVAERDHNSRDQPVRAVA